jgi:hypothetical protein
MVRATAFYSATNLQDGIPVQRWELNEGEERNFRDYFSVLEGAHIENAIIKDPYCGAGETQRSYLRELIQVVSEISNTLKNITIHCREQNFKDPRYTAPYKIIELLTTEISSAFPSIKPVIHVHGFKTSRIFHDRTLDFQVVDNEGCTVTHRFDLTGGIDFLMDRNAPTKIYRYEIEK